MRENPAFYVIYILICSRCKPARIISFRAASSNHVIVNYAQSAKERALGYVRYVNPWFVIPLLEYAIDE